MAVSYFTIGQSGTRITDACIASSLDVLEENFYSGLLYDFDESEWFHVAIVWRLFAHWRELKLQLESRECERMSESITNEMMQIMVSLPISSV